MWLPGNPTIQEDPMPFAAGVFPTPAALRATGPVGGEKGSGRLRKKAERRRLVVMMRVPVQLVRQPCRLGVKSVSVLVLGLGPSDGRFAGIRAILGCPRCILNCACLN